MPYRDATDHVGAERRPFVRVLGHQFPGAVRVGAAALHDLHEAGLVWVALHVDRDVVAAADGGPAVVELLRVGPPLVLLGPLAVATGRVLRLEADHRDGPAVLGDPTRGAEPAGCA